MLYSKYIQTEMKLPKTYLFSDSFVLANKKTNCPQSALRDAHIKAFVKWFQTPRSHCELTTLIDETIAVVKNRRASPKLISSTARPVSLADENHPNFPFGWSHPKRNRTEIPIPTTLGYDGGEGRGLPVPATGLPVLSVLGNVSIFPSRLRSGKRLL